MKRFTSMAAAACALYAALFAFSLLAPETFAQAKKRLTTDGAAIYDAASGGLDVDVDVSAADGIEQRVEPDGDLRVIGQVEIGGNGTNEGCLSRDTSTTPDKVFVDYNCDKAKNLVGGTDCYLGECGGGSGTPGGSSGQVQINVAGAFAGDAGLTYDTATDTLTVGSPGGNGALIVRCTSGNCATLFDDNSAAPSATGDGVTMFSLADRPMYRRQSDTRVRPFIAANTPIDTNASGAVDTMILEGDYDGSGAVDTNDIEAALDALCGGDRFACNSSITERKHLHVTGSRYPYPSGLAGNPAANRFAHIHLPSYTTLSCDPGVVLVGVGHAVQGNWFIVSNTNHSAGNDDVEVRGCTLDGGLASTVREAVTTSAGTTTTLVDSAGGWVDDQHNGLVIFLRPGTATEERQLVDDTVDSTDTLTVNALTPWKIPPASGDRYWIGGFTYSSPTNTSRGGVWLDKTRNSKLISNRIANTVGSCIYQSNGNRLLIESNLLNGCASYWDITSPAVNVGGGIYLYASAGNVDETTIRGNLLRQSKNGILITNDGAGTDALYAITVRHNLIDDASGPMSYGQPGIGVRNAINSEISGNVTLRGGFFQSISVGTAYSTPEKPDATSGPLNLIVRGNYASCAAASGNTCVLLDDYTDGLLFADNTIVHGPLGRAHGLSFTCPQRRLRIENTTIRAMMQSGIKDVGSCGSDPREYVTLDGVNVEGTGFTDPYSTTKQPALWLDSAQTGLTIKNSRFASSNTEEVLIEATLTESNLDFEVDGLPPKYAGTYTFAGRPTCNGTAYDLNNAWIYQTDSTSCSTGTGSGTSRCVCDQDGSAAWAAASFPAAAGPVEIAANMTDTRLKVDARNTTNGSSLVTLGLGGDQIYRNTPIEVLCSHAIAAGAYPTFCLDLGDAAADSFVDSYSLGPDVSCRTSQPVFQNETSCLRNLAADYIRRREAMPFTVSFNFNEPTTADITAADCLSMQTGQSIPCAGTAEALTACFDISSPTGIGIRDVSGIVKSDTAAGFTTTDSVTLSLKRRSQTSITLGSAGSTLSGSGLTWTALEADNLFHGTTAGIWSESSEDSVLCLIVSSLTDDGGMTLEGTVRVSGEIQPW